MTPPPQVPYIGSTISLLSKANIRYEGFLYTIDQKESSVALSHVKVFGTEDRQCDRPVPPSDEIFEFIIFRASDITELKVIDTPPVRSVPDPAIIRAQNKPPSDQETNASVKDFLMQAGPSAAAASAGGASAAPGARGREIKREPASQHAPVAAANVQTRYPRNQQQTAGSTNNAGTGVISNYGRSQPNRVNNNQAKQNQQYPNSNYYGNGYQQQQRRGGYRGPPLPPPNAGAGSSGNGGYYGSHYQPPPYGRYGGPPPFYSAPMPPSSYYGPGMNSRRGGRPIIHFRRFHGGNAGGNRWGRGQPQQHRQQHQQQRQSVDPIPARFTADYDFETANAEMEAELAKLNIDPHQQRHLDGEGDVNNQEHEAEQQQQNKPHFGYDKEKSFYDDISRVDFDERPGSGDANNNSGAVNGKKEAQKQNALNKETFGMIGGRMRRGIGNRFFGNRHYQHQRRTAA